jgi:hypothetical protein
MNFLQDNQVPLVAQDKNLQHLGSAKIIQKKNHSEDYKTERAILKKYGDYSRRHQVNIKLDLRGASPQALHVRRRPSHASYEITMERETSNSQEIKKSCWHLNPLQPQGKLLEHLELSKYKMKNTWSSQAHSNTAASSCCKHSECGEMNCLAALHLAEYIYTKFYLLPATKVH